MRLYIDTSVLVTYTYFAENEKNHFRAVKILLDKCIKDGIELVISFYSLHELYLLAFEYPTEKAEDAGLDSIRAIINLPIKLVPLLAREKRLYYQQKFKMKDRTDIPHAIVAFIHNCDYIVTYDEHFKEISTQISVATPEEIVVKL